MSSMAAQQKLFKGKLGNLRCDQPIAVRRQMTKIDVHVFVDVQSTHQIVKSAIFCHAPFNQWIDRLKLRTQIRISGQQMIDSGLAEIQDGLKDADKSTTI